MRSALELCWRFQVVAQYFAKWAVVGLLAYQIEARVGRDSVRRDVCHRLERISGLVTFRLPFRLPFRACRLAPVQPLRGFSIEWSMSPGGYLSLAGKIQNPLFNFRWCSVGCALTVPKEVGNGFGSAQRSGTRLSTLLRSLGS